MKYLASPYHHNNPRIMQIRYEQACEATADLIKSGEVIFSPIAHNHWLAIIYDMPRDHQFWLDYNLAILRRCDVLLILTLEGWKESRGIAAESTFAAQHHIPIEFLEPLTWQRS